MLHKNLTTLMNILQVVQLVVSGNVEIIVLH